MEATLLETRVSGGIIPSQPVEVLGDSPNLGTDRSGVVILLADSRALVVQEEELVPLQFASLVEGFLG
jgi:hypothetical protein